MENTNFKKILFLCLPIIFALTLAIMLAAGMAQAEKSLGDSMLDQGKPEDTGGNMGTILLILAIAAVGGGAGWYFKVYRPKQQRAAETVEEDYGDELDAFDDPEDDTPPWDEDEV